MKRVEIRVLDLPYIHLGKSTISDRYNINLLFDKMAETENVTVFSYASVKALIEIKWNYIWYRIISLLMIPYIIFVFLFTFYTAYDLEVWETAEAENL